MVFTEKDVKRWSLILIIATLALLVFLIIRPIIISIIAGLLLAYIFLPVYRRLVRYIKSPNTSAALVSIIVVILIILPLWFLIPVIIQQVFDFFQFSQNLNVRSIIEGLFPRASEQAISQIDIMFSGATSKISSAILNQLVEFLIDFPIISLHLLIVAFVFFFAMRDEEKLSEFASALSPLNKTQEKSLVKQFKDITNSIIYGQVIIGIIQGILAGLGFLVFGVPNALLFTILAVVMAIIPVIGPVIIYLPVALYILYAQGIPSTLVFLAYNILIVSTIDNILRVHLVSRKTDHLSPVTIVIGMVGGFFIFGILGLILGPLILSYFIIFLKAYKDKTLSSLFSSD